MLLTFLYRYEIHLSLGLVELSGSMALLVYVTFLTSDENLKNGEMASLLSFNRFISWNSDTWVSIF